jgi:hypothetical protein
LEAWTHESSTPPALDELRSELSKLDGVYAELHALALCEDDNWDHRMRDLRGPSLYNYQFPDVQEARGLTKLLGLKLDLQIANGDIDGAIGTLQDGFRLASFVCNGETLVQQLVGVSISGVMLSKLEKLIQHPSCPNLYWAMASLPRPFSRVNQSIQFELGSIDRVLPVLANVESTDNDAASGNDAWNAQLKELSELGIADIEAQFKTVVDSSDQIKQRLLESGRTEKSLDSMSQVQLALIDASSELRRVADDLAKGTMLPGTAGHKITQEEYVKFDKWFRENRDKSIAALFSGLLFPAVYAATMTDARHEYVLNRLMTLEALRLHAATAEGKLAKTLDELSVLPAMPNPYTGQHYDYKIDTQEDSTTVTLAGDGPILIDSIKKLTFRFRD